MRGQRHALADLYPPGKTPYPLYRRLQIPIVTDYFISTANAKNESRMILEGAHGWLCELEGGMYVNVLTKGHTKRSKQK